MDIPDNFREWFGYGTSPYDWQETPPNLAELKTLLENQPDKIRRLYADRMEVEFPTTHMGIRTVEQVLPRIIFHEGIHHRDIQLLKRSVIK